MLIEEPSNIDGHRIEQNIPRQIQDDTWEKAPFHQSEKEAAGEKALIVVNLRGQGGDNAPRCAEKREQNARPDLLQHQVGWQLGGYVGHVCDGDG